MSVICDLLWADEKSLPLAGRPMKGLWNGPVTEIDDRSPKDVTRQGGAQSRAETAIEKGQAKFTGVLIHSAFAGAGDAAFAHQGRHACRWHMQKLADECGVYQECIVAEFNGPVGRPLGLGLLATLDHLDFLLVQAS